MKRETAFATVALAMLAVLAGANIPAPLYDGYRRAWGLSPFEIAAVFAVYPLSLVFALWSFGRISDRFGRRPVILGALVAGAFGSLLFALAHDIAYLYAARITQAIAVGLLSGSASAALVELQAHGDRRRASLVATSMLAAGTAIGPLASGILAEYAPLPMVLPYAIHVALLVPLIAFTFGLPETAPALGQAGAWLPRLPALAPELRRGFTIASLTSGLSWLTAAPFISLLPSYMRVTLGVHNLALIGAVAFVMLGTSALAQVMVRQLRDRALIVSALVTATVGYACIILAVPLQAMVLIGAAAVVSGFGHACGAQGGLIMVNRIAPEATRGEILSLHYSVLYCIVGVPMLAVGVLATFYGFFAAFVVLAATIAALAITIALMLVYDATRISVGLRYGAPSP